MYLGGSITLGTGASDANATAYVPLTAAWLDSENPTLNIIHHKKGVGGTPSWYGLVRLATDVIYNTPNMVVLEFAVNDSNIPLSKASGEALIRRLRTALPNARLIAIFFLSVADRTTNDDTNLKEAVKQNWIALCTQYDIPYVDYAAQVQTLVPDTNNLADFFPVGDNVHPNDTGHALASTLLRSDLAALLPNTDQWTAPLPARIYDDGSYEHTPIIRVMTSNDGTTGAWTPSGTALVSSEAGATVTYSGTFHSFGLDFTHSGSAVAEWQIDGGDWTELNLTTGADNTALWSGTRGAHMVIVRVKSGTATLNRFLAI